MINKKFSHVTDIFRDLLGMNNLNAFECIGDVDYTCYVFNKIINKRIIQFEILPEDIRNYISNLAMSNRLNIFDNSININNLSCIYQLIYKINSENHLIHYLVK